MMFDMATRDLLIMVTQYFVVLGVLETALALGIRATVIKVVKVLKEKKLNTKTTN